MWSTMRFVLGAIGHGIISSLWVLRLLHVMGADGATTLPCAIRNWQTRRAMLVQFSARFVKRLTRTTASRRWPHDFFDLNFRSAPVISRHATTHVTLGDDAYQFEMFRILHHWGATAARRAHRLRSVRGRVSRRTARRRFDGFHDITTTAHVLFSCSKATACTSERCLNPVTHRCAIEHGSIAWLLSGSAFGSCRREGSTRPGCDPGTAYARARCGVPNGTDAQADASGCSDRQPSIRHGDYARSH